MDLMPVLTMAESIERLPKDEVLMRCRDVAYALGVGPGDLFDMRRDGTGPKFIRVGKTAMYRTNDVEDFIRAQFSELAEIQRERSRRMAVRASA